LRLAKWTKTRFAAKLADIRDAVSIESGHIGPFEPSVRLDRGRIQNPQSFVSCVRAKVCAGIIENKEQSMGIGVSLILVAAGAILTWAVSATVSGLNIHTVGVILMVVGAIGLLLSLMFWSSWGGFGSRSATVVEDGPRTT
jgi:hypothetical protein